MYFRTWCILATGGGTLLYLISTNQSTMFNQTIISALTILGVNVMDDYIQKEKVAKKK